MYQKMNYVRKRKDEAVNKQSHDIRASMGKHTAAFCVLTSTSLFGNGNVFL